MDEITRTVTLRHGLLLDKRRQTTVVLGELTGADVLYVHEQIARPDGSGGGIGYFEPGQGLMKMRELGRRVRKFGDIAGPLDVETLGLLKMDDLNRLFARGDEIEREAARAGLEGGGGAAGARTDLGGDPQERPDGSPAAGEGQRATG